MPFYSYSRVRENERHMGAHGVSREEFQEVVSDPDDTEESRSSGRSIARGMTPTGR